MHRLPHLGELSISVRTRNYNNGGDGTYDIRRLPVRGGSEEVTKFTKLMTASRLNNRILTSPYHNKTQSLKRFIHIKNKSTSTPKVKDEVD